MSRALVEDGLAWRWRIGKVVRTIRSRETLCVVAENRAGRLLGFAFMHYAETRAHLLLLAVSPRARRKGLGRELIDWHLTCCRNCGVEEVVLEVRASNVGGRKFYDSLGFTEEKRVRGYYQGREDAARMKLNLQGLRRR
jgi:ribosomal-protein-alanine N-acetyltransferase